MSETRTIAGLEEQIASLPADAQARFEAIFDLNVTVGQLVPPTAMRPWLAEHFGSVQAVQQQRIVKITNRVTLEGSLFNELRASRPIQAPANPEDLEETIQAQVGGPFCHPETGTPADTFGRVRGRSSTSASNVAKYDGWHAVIVFDSHHPLHFTAAQVADYIDTAQEWVQAAHRADPGARYPFFLWNCLWRSGASILHGHAQITLTRGMHYARVEAWRQAAHRYQTESGRPYFQDLIAICQDLGLLVSLGEAAIYPSLTPFKDKEIHIVAPRLAGDLKLAIYRVLATMTEKLGVQSFNLALYQPPLANTAEDWTGFPIIARIIDRGSLHSRTSDIGSMEIFAQSVVATDPFRVAEALRNQIKGVRT
jgi:galactose-1-phosphate uridylyltransferase